jgi:DNA mismatch repair protein MLH1
MDRDEHFYQLGLRQFGAFDRLRLDPAPSLRDLLSLAAEYEDGIGENGLDPDVVVQVGSRSET